MGKQEREPQSIGELIEIIREKGKRVKNSESTCFPSSLDFAASGRVKEELYEYVGEKEGFDPRLLIVEEATSHVIGALEVAIRPREGFETEIVASSSYFLKPSEVERTRPGKNCPVETKIPKNSVFKQLRRGVRETLRQLQEGEKDEKGRYLEGIVLAKTEGPKIHVDALGALERGSIVHFDADSDNLIQQISSQTAEREVTNAWRKGVVLLVMTKEKGK